MDHQSPRLEPNFRTPTIVGHRGSPRRCAENTVASVRRAVMEGAAAVEVDVCRTRDGRLVLWRDDRPNEPVALARQAGLVDLYAVPEVPRFGSGLRRAVGELDLAEMRESHGYHRRRGILSEVLGLRRDRRIPLETLEDLLIAASRMPGLAHLYLDLRLDAGLAPEVFRLSARLTHFEGSRHGSALTFHVMSESAEVVKMLQKAATRGPGNLVAYADITRPGVLETARTLRVRNVTLGGNGRSWDSFRAELVEVLRARDRGELDRVAVWTVNDPRRLEELMDLRPDAVLTDDVPLALRLSHPGMRGVGSHAGAEILPEGVGELTLV